MFEVSLFSVLACVVFVIFLVSGIISLLIFQVDEVDGLNRQLKANKNIHGYEVKILKEELARLKSLIEFSGRF